MRRLVLVVCALFVGAIGSAFGASGDPTKAFTKRDQGWAKSIVVRQKDLPKGIKWTAYSTAGSGGSGGASGQGCPGVPSDNSDLTETGAAGSPVFIDTNRQYAIFSGAWIFKTSAQARSFNRRLTSGMVRCGTAALKAEVGAVKSAQLLSYGPHPIAGMRRWWTYRIVLMLHDQGLKVKSFVDMGFVQNGRATGSLILHGAITPLSASDEAELARLMFSRMSRQAR